MDRALASAKEHLRRMESRIERQLELVERLRKAGQDTSEPVRKLALLQAAFAEMRIQIGHLIPEEAKPANRSRPSSRRPLPAAEKK
jgi:nucleotidyltransferase/DNA polymerase involved in DNA repair